MGTNPFSNLQAATAISNNGNYIVGYGTVHGVIHGFLLTATAPLPGDANLDGKVDINDLSRVLTNYDKSGMTWADGDFNGDGKVDINDLSIVLTNYDKSLGAAGGTLAAVPEPVRERCWPRARPACWRRFGEDGSRAPSGE